MIGEIPTGPFSSSSTPTAAPGSDRPTTLSFLLVHPSLVFRALDRLVHTSDTTSTSPL